MILGCCFNRLQKIPKILPLNFLENNIISDLQYSTLSCLINLL
jgi:hypothetical protein